MKFFLTLIIVVNLFCPVNHAAFLDTFSFTGIVKNVSNDKLTVLCQGQQFQILKTDVLSGIISPGEPIYFQIKADQMQKTFFKRKPAKN